MGAGIWVGNGMTKSSHTQVYTDAAERSAKTESEKQLKKQKKTDKKANLLGLTTQLQLTAERELHPTKSLKTSSLKT